MRLFIGTWLSPAMRTEVANYITSIKGEYPGLKWSRPEQLHFTLKFLGEVPADRVLLLKRSLENCRGRAEFSVKLGRTGCFPERGEPRVFWVGLESGASQLIELAAEIESLCSQIGFPRSNKPFQPHLTIARIKEGAKEVAPLTRQPDWKATTNVAGVTLIESKLQPRGSVYESLGEFPFR